VPTPSQIHQAAFAATARQHGGGRFHFPKESRYVAGLLHTGEIAQRQGAAAQSTPGETTYYFTYQATEGLQEGASLRTPQGAALILGPLTTSPTLPVHTRKARLGSSQ
jgi:hypothetical protein